MTTQLLQTGVLSGCDVTQHGAGAMSVDVAAGSVLYQNAPASVAAATVTITAAHATVDRIDYVVASSAGVLSAIAGTVVDPTTVLPPDTTGYVPLAQVYVINQADANYTGTILTATITGEADLLLVHTSPYKVSGTWYTALGSGRTTFSFGSGTWNNRMILMPFFLGKAMTIQTLAVNVTTAGTAGSLARLGVYADDGSGALSLLIDAGTVAVDAIATPTIAASVVLSPGFVWTACALQSLGATAPSLSVLGQTPITPIGSATALRAITTPDVGFFITGVSGALPAATSVAAGTTNQTAIISVAMQAA